MKDTFLLKFMYIFQKKSFFLPFLLDALEVVGGQCLDQVDSDFFPFIFVKTGNSGSDVFKNRFQSLMKK